MWRWESRSDGSGRYACSGRRAVWCAADGRRTGLVMPASFTPEEARRIGEQVVELPGADAVEVVVMGSTIALTRFARSQIIQNTIQETVRAYIRVAVGRRVASASTNQFNAKSIGATADRALESALKAPDDPEFPGFPSPAEVGAAAPVMRWDEATASTGADVRARAIADILALTQGSEAAGIYETSSHAYSVVSSSGMDCHDAYTRCVVSCLADIDGATGYHEASSHCRDAIDHETVARTAAGKARSGAGAGDVAPGEYEVVLEPAAVAMLLDYLSYAGFGAKQMIDGESFFSKRIGQRVARPSVTVADDVTHPLSVGIGFDFEGVPRKRVAVIERGTAVEPVTDYRTARRLGRQPSGHYSGSNEWGPYASNILMEPGDATSEQLVAGVADGLLVTRFHYVNVLDRPTALLTGMTRDGLWRIRQGEVAEPVHNLRFTQSVLDALDSECRVGRDLHAFAAEFGGFGSTVAPSLHVGRWAFTSATSH
jgi:PmbA protein